MEPIRVIIVDDEKLVINDLVRMVDWSSLGFEIIAIAYNGKQALTKITEMMPDLIITDIKMPFMDGLQLIQSVRKLFIQTKILILTAYRDFEYAKQGIEQKITDYLLKEEINEQVLTSKLLAIKEQIINERQKSFALSRSKLMDFFSDSYSSQELDTEPIIKKLKDSPYYYLIIELDAPINFTGTSNSLVNKTCMHKIAEYCITQKYENINVIISGRINSDQVLLVIQPDFGYSKYTTSNILQRYAHSLKKAFEEMFINSFSMYYMSEPMRLDEMKAFYKKHYERFLAKYLFEIGKVYDFLDNGLDLKEEETDFNLATINEAIENMDGPLIAEEIDLLYSKVLPPKRDFKNFLLLSQSLFLVLKENMEKIPDLKNSYRFIESSEKSEWMDAESVKSWIKKQFTFIISEKIRMQEKRYSRPIIKTIDYIHKNYSKSDLSIDNLAVYIGISGTRLSVLFKKETGVTINDFITDTRVNKAKEYLIKGDLKVYEISELIGYGSSQYFSQIFRNATGITPNDYRRGITDK